MAVEWTEDLYEKLAKRYEELATVGVPLYPTLPDEFGVSERTIRNRLAELRDENRIMHYRDYVSGDDSDVIDKDDPQKQAVMTGLDRNGSSYVEAKGPQITTLRELLDAGLVDDDLIKYAITGYKRNKWDTHIRDADGNIVCVTNWQVKASFGLRKKVEGIRQLQREVIEDIRKVAGSYPPKYTRRASKEVEDGHLLEIGLFDLHLGNLSWHEETGEDWDIGIAAEVFRSAIEMIADRASQMYAIDKILFPIGNDFFHADSKENKTTAGTQMDLDTRFVKMYRTGVALQRWAIDLLRQIAPVEVIVVPGNHDELTSFFLGEMLSGIYEGVDDVEILNSPMLRKYYRYGETLIGFTHGCHEPNHKLPNLMAAEAKELWGQTTFREFHIGHVHHRKGSRFLAEYEDLEGVMIRALPSLTATDDWHRQKGWSSAVRAAEAYVYHPEHGLVGQIHTQRFQNIRKH